MTKTQAREHFEGRLELIKAEMRMITEGVENEDFWARNRGTQSAMYHFGELIKNYERVLRVIDNYPFEEQAMRPMGLMVVWQVKPEWKIMANGLFGYYQNGIDYLNDYARAKGWTLVEGFQRTSLTYETSGGEYRIELSLVEPKGMDLSKETYLFQDLEITDGEKTEA